MQCHPDTVTVSVLDLRYLFNEIEDQCSTFKEKSAYKDRLIAFTCPTLPCLYYKLQRQ